MQSLNNAKLGCMVKYIVILLKYWYKMKSLDSSKRILNFSHRNYYS